LRIYYFAGSNVIVISYAPVTKINEEQQKQIKIHIATHDVHFFFLRYWNKDKVFAPKITKVTRGKLQGSMEYIQAYTEFDKHQLFQIKE